MLNPQDWNNCWRFLRPFLVRHCLTISADTLYSPLVLGVNTRLILPSMAVGERRSWPAFGSTTSPTEPPVAAGVWRSRGPGISGGEALEGKLRAAERNTSEVPGLSWKMIIPKLHKYWGDWWSLGCPCHAIEFANKNHITTKRILYVQNLPWDIQSNFRWTLHGWGFEYTMFNFRQQIFHVKVRIWNFSLRQRWFLGLSFWRSQDFKIEGRWKQTPVLKPVATLLPNNFKTIYS